MLVTQLEFWITNVWLLNQMTLAPFTRTTKRLYFIANLFSKLTGLAHILQYEASGIFKHETVQTHVDIRVSSPLHTHKCLSYLVYNMH